MTEVTRLDEEVATSDAALREVALRKVPTGISGLDDVLTGGLPQGRTTLVCGGAGCGKTLFGMQFLVAGARGYGEPGVFIAFEERPEDLATNVASLGIDLLGLQAQNLLSIDHVRVDPAEIIENGDYDLEGLFLRIGLAIDSVGAKRVVLDTLETLFGGLTNYGVVRAELRRLFDWLKDRGVTAIVTAERGESGLTRHGLEEYVSDCVILLDHRVIEQVSTRRLRVVKYRGSTHGTNEYPFLIDAKGLSVLPVTSAGLAHAVSDARVTTGVARLDVMLGGGGYFRGSTVLVSGTAGAGKSSLAAHFAHASCVAGDRVLFFSFEESPSQIARNMRSIGMDLAQHVDSGRLRFVSARPTAHGIETHLALIHRCIVEFQPSALVMDPVSNMTGVGAARDAHHMMVRLIDFLKERGITALLTSLTDGGAAAEKTDVAISSIVDTWLLLRNLEANGERNRGLYVLKSRGMAHSNQIREFLLTDRGIQLIDVYVGEEGVVTGSARAAQEAKERAAAHARMTRAAAMRRQLERRRALHREQLAKLEAEFEAEVFELESSLASAEVEEKRRAEERSRMADLRGAHEALRGDGM